MTSNDKRRRAAEISAARPSSPSTPPVTSLRRSLLPVPTPPTGRRRHLARPVPRVGRNAFGLQPPRMVLARPVQVHLAVAHGIERAFHPKCADVDVPED